MVPEFICSGVPHSEVLVFFRIYYEPLSPNINRFFSEFYISVRNPFFSALRQYAKKIIAYRYLTFFLCFCLFCIHFTLLNFTFFFIFLLSSFFHLQELHFTVVWKQWPLRSDNFLPLEHNADVISPWLFFFEYFLPIIFFPVFPLNSFFIKIRHKHFRLVIFYVAGDKPERRDILHFS